MGREHYTFENTAASSVGLRVSRWVAQEDSEGWTW